MFCAKCGKQVEGNAEFCTQCGVQRASTSPDKPKKSNKTRNIVIGVIGVVIGIPIALIALGVTVTLFSGEDGSSGLSQNLEVGQSAQTSNQKVTVLSADRDVQGDYTLITVNAQVQK